MGLATPPRKTQLATETNTEEQGTGERIDTTQDTGSMTAKADRTLTSRRQTSSPLKTYVELDAGTYAPSTKQEG